MKMMNEDGGDQVVQRPELVDSDRAAQVCVATKTEEKALSNFRYARNLFTTCGHAMGTSC